MFGNSQRLSGYILGKSRDVFFSCVKFGLGAFVAYLVEIGAFKYVMRRFEENEVANAQLGDPIRNNVCTSRHLFEL